jgi:hypothetical protein
MQQISGRYVSKYDAGKRDKTGRLYCPFCSEVYPRREMEEYSEEGSERSLEICSNCREGFEQEFEQKFDSDVLSKEVFARLWEEGALQDEEARGLNETTAPQVALALGGSEWQSGGGIWLVVIRRADGKVVAISDEVVCEYANEKALDAGEEPERSILLV